MLVLQFEQGGYRFALDVRDVIEVLPLVELHRPPDAPRGLAGLFEFRGTPVTAIDFAELTSGQPAARRLSTRIIVIREPGKTTGGRLLGLIAERPVTIDDSRFIDTSFPGFVALMRKLGAAIDDA